MTTTKKIFKSIFNTQQYGLPFNSHYKLGEGLIQKGKTKKFKMYVKGFTYKSLLKDKTYAWTEIDCVNFSWREDTVNLSGTEVLKIYFTFKNGEKLKVKFTSPIFIMPVDLSGKNENILKMIYYFGSEYDFDVNKSWY
tara:strand:+ start:166 stop:579 length:414 start_codon:yes stop_codon:yes gene_type:complete